MSLLIIFSGYKRICAKESILNEEKDAMLEKKDSKESSSTVTNEIVINCSQSDYINTTSNTVMHIDSGHKSDSVMENSQHTNLNTDSTNTDTLQSNLRDEEEVHDLASFLIKKCSRNSTLANYLYWYLLIECEDQEQTVKQDVSCIITSLSMFRSFSNFRVIMTI